MSFTTHSYEELNESFGMRLDALRCRDGYKSAAKIAEALWENAVCYKLVHPRGRENRLNISRKKDIASIARRVSDHLAINMEAINVSGNYMLAYSILFHVSLDYLYGVIDMEAPDAEIADISAKTGIAPSAVEMMIECNDSDPEVFSYTRFWSDLLDGKLFSELPESWIVLVAQIIELNDLQKKISAIESTANASGFDADYKAMQLMKKEMLERYYLEVDSRRDSALRRMIDMIVEPLAKSAERYAASKHIDYEESYYNYEIKKIELIKTALQEGAPSSSNMPKKKSRT